MKVMLKILAFVGIVAGVLLSVKIALEILQSCGKRYYTVENTESAF